MSSHISNSLTNFLDLFTTHSHKPCELKDDMNVEEMVEHVVEVVDPRIRVIGKYAKKLTQPISRTWDYLTDMANMIPAGTTLSRASYTDDPRAKAIFGTQEILQQLLDTVSPIIHENEYGAKNSPTQVYMLLCMEKKESSFLGAELEGDIIKRDVLKTKVTFSNHKFLSAGYTEKDAKLGFKTCALEGLLQKAHDLVMTSSNDLKPLIERKRELHHQLHAIQKTQPQGPSSIFSHNDYLINAPPELLEIELQLKEMRIKSESPDHHLTQAIEVLNYPEQYLKMEVQSIRLNNHGVKLPGKTMDAGINLDYAEVEVEQELKRVAIIVNCPAKDIFSAKIH